METIELSKLKLMIDQGQILIGNKVKNSRCSVLAIAEAADEEAKPRLINGCM